MELDNSKENGSLSAKDYPKALSAMKKEFPQGIPECGADSLRFGLLTSDIKSKFNYKNPLSTNALFTIASSSEVKGCKGFRQGPP